MKKDAEKYIRYYLDNDDIEVPCQVTEELVRVFKKEHINYDTEDSIWMGTISNYFKSNFKNKVFSLINKKQPVTFKIKRSDILNLVAKIFFAPGISNLSETEKQKRADRIITEYIDSRKNRKVYGVKFTRNGYANILARSEEEAMDIAHHLYTNSVEWVDNNWGPVNIQDSKYNVHTFKVITDSDFNENKNSKKEKAEE